MSNVVRLSNGGTIIVRTGVIQGIGPQGPRGVAGNQGSQGEQGPIGEQGPMGQILKRGGLTRVGSSNPVAANTDTVVAFGAPGYDDDLAAFGPGSSVCTLTSPGDYMLSVWLKFDSAAAGSREVWFASAGSTLARASHYTGVAMDFYVNLAFPFRAVGGEVINTLVRSSVATTIAAGGCWAVTMMGSGPVGPPGPEGPQGPLGPQGAKGDPGASGTANSGFAKYSDLLPH